MKYFLTKRIAKHGRQAVIIVPKLLEKNLKPGTVVNLAIDVIGREEADV